MESVGPSPPTEVIKFCSFILIQNLESWHPLSRTKRVSGIDKSQDLII